MGNVTEQTDGERTGRYVLGFHEIDRTQVAVVGGKGAHLGELSRIDGVRVPAGFCVTTDAFRADHGGGAVDRRPARSPVAAERGRSGGDRRAQRGDPERHRSRRNAADDVAAAITGALARLGERAAYAVRSSATAEDLPTASFAGQQDTYLNIVGPAAILEHVSRCWASLFTERAVTYRLRNGIDHRQVADGRGRAADGLPGRGRRPVHGRSGHGQPQGRLGGGELRPRRGARLGPRERRRLQGARRRGRRQVGRHEAARRPRLAGGGTEEQAIEPARQSSRR